MFLSKISLPSVIPDQLASLNREIIDAEVVAAIKQLALGKAPGPDGYTGEFYKSLNDLIALVLTRHYNDILTTGHIRPESTNAFIKVLPKQGKDLLNPGSYRPISLIDLNQKLLTKDHG